MLDPGAPKTANEAKLGVLDGYYLPLQLVACWLRLEGLVNDLMEEGSLWLDGAAASNGDKALFS